MASRARLVLADDHRVVAEGIARVLQTQHEILATVGSAAALGEAIAHHVPDAVVSDIAMPDASGLDVLDRLRAAANPVPFVFLTMHDEPELAARALKAGASAYVLKSAAGDELLVALGDALAGRRYVTPSIAAALCHADPMVVLTPRQRAVLALVAQGKRAREVAAALDLSVRTVEAHKQTIMHALGVHNSAELVRHALKLGLVEL